MKVKKSAYFPTGEHRPPREGEFYAPEGIDAVVQSASFDWIKSHGSRDIYERREVEVEVPEAVPEWIENLGGPDVPYSLLRAFADSFRAHVAERAKAAVDRWYDGPGDRLESEDARQYVTRVIREEMLRA